MLARRRLLLWGSLGALSAVVGGWLVYVERHAPVSPNRARCTRNGVVDEECVSALDTIDRYLPELERYGPPLYSQGIEETLIRDFFRDRRGGVFLDVGAGHYKDHGTTYYLEKHLGWSGIAIDAQADFADDYAKNRPQTKFFAYFVSDTSAPAHPFFVSNKWGLSSGDKDYVARQGGVAREIELPSITLNDLLDREGVKKVSFVSMDIEQGEPAALAGFDIARYGVELVCIEMQAETKQAIERYFEKNGYARVKRYSAFDANNGYFAPKGSPRIEEREP